MPQLNSQYQEEHDSSDKNNSKCPYCHRRFHTPDELTLHIVTRHTQSGIKRGGPAQAGSGSK